MNFRDLLSFVPERAFYIVTATVAALILWGAYGFYRDARLMDAKIASKQVELGRVVSLRDSYLSLTGVLKKAASRKAGASALSLGQMETMATKYFTSGTLTSLKPVTLKEQKARAEAVIELKVTGAALGEVIGFVTAAESSGLVFRKLQITLPQEQELVDFYGIVAEKL